MLNQKTTVFFAKLVLLVCTFSTLNNAHKIINPTNKGLPQGHYQGQISINWGAHFSQLNTANALVQTYRSLIFSLKGFTLLYHKLHKVTIKNSRIRTYLYQCQNTFYCF